MSDIKQVIIEHNEQVKKFCQDHDLDVDTHFSRLSSEAHPVVKSASRKFRILAEPMLQFIGDLGRAFSALPREAKEVLNKETAKISSSPYPTSMTNFNYRIEQSVSISCPIIWAEKKKEVIYFPNLPSPIVQLLRNIRSDYITKLQHTSSPPYHFDVYRDLCNIIKKEDALLPYFSVEVIDKIDDELQDLNKRNAWLPIHRGIRRLARRNTVTLERALTRLLMWNGRYIAELERGSWLIEVIAETIRSLSKPPVIKQCSTIDDYVDMYILTAGESPGSCMDSTHNFGKVLRPEVLEYRTASTVTPRKEVEGRPVEWYHFCPISTGHYLCRGTVVLARTFTYEYDDKKVYTRVYGHNQAHKLQLTDHLKSKGFTSYKEKSTESIKEPIKFHIPYYKSGNNDCVPMPYFDWIPFLTVYGKPRNDGVDIILLGSLAGTGKTHNDVIPDGYFSMAINSTSGYWFPEDKWQRDDEQPYLCVTCDNEIYVEEDEYYEGNGDLYCSKECFSEVGFWTTHNMSDTPRTLHDSVPINRDDPRWELGVNEIDMNRPTIEDGFVHQYYIDNVDDINRYDFLKITPTCVPLRIGYANTYVATRTSMLLTNYSCAVSEDVHFMSPSSNVRHTLLTHIISYGKGEVAVTKWCTPAIPTDIHFDAITLSAYFEPCPAKIDNEIWASSIVTKHFHLFPIRVPIDNEGEQIDISKPYPLLTKQALSGLSTPTVDVDSMIASHVELIKKNYAYVNDYNCTQYLTPIIFKENI